MAGPPLLDPRTSSVVRYYPGPGSGQGVAPDGATGDDLALAADVQRAVDEWVPTICSFLHRRPLAPIMVTLRRGTWVARTKGTHVLLPVPPGADAASALGSVKAGLAHELVHAVAGRLSNDALHEGLAVHVDATLRLAGPSWPFGLLSPHRWTAMLREEGTFTSLADLLSGRATPHADAPVNALILHWARYYLEAGSFVGFLMDELGGDRYLAPGSAAATLPDGEGLAALEKAWLEALGGPPTEAEWRRRDESVKAQVDRHRGVGRPAGCVRPPG